MNIFFSELIGTAILVAGVLLLNNPFHIAIAFLIAILVASSSKAHINPVITMVKQIQGTISSNESIEYLGGQVVGALLAYYIVKNTL
jgi:glycerol uptake facilitator-like aquaporin